MQFSNKPFVLVSPNISEALGSIPAPAGEEKGEREGKGGECGEEKERKKKTETKKVTSSSSSSGNSP